MRVLPGNFRAKLLTPSSLFWVIGHLIIFAFGLFLTIYATQSTYKDIWIGIGGSLIASGIAGEVLYLYVAFSEETRDRLELFTTAGLLRIFETRSVRIREEYESRLKGAKEIDVLGFGLSSFREDYGDQFAELSKRISFRVLILNPSFPSAETSVASIRDKEEHNNHDQIKKDVEAFENKVRSTKGLNRSNFKVRHVNALPSINIFRIDDEIFWGPYLVAQQSRNMPTLLVRKGGFLFDQIKKHFDQLWSDPELSRPIPE